LIARTSPNRFGWRNLTHRPDDFDFGSAPKVDVLATVIHTSDWHICDVASTARLEYLDRFFNSGHQHRLTVGPVGTYRPNEFLTRHVADASIRTFNSFDSGLAWGRRIDAVMITGDLLDNSQSNELADLVTLLEGGFVQAKDALNWVGSENAIWDDDYWHPESHRTDKPRSNFGYPKVPGLLQAAERGFYTPGLGHRFVIAHGNHDALLQGTVPNNEKVSALLTGGRRVTGVGPNTTVGDIKFSLAEIGPANYIHNDEFPSEVVADGLPRAFVGPNEFFASLGSLSGNLGNPARVDTKYFATQVGKLFFIVLDTVNPHGGYQGSIDKEQLGWLVQLLHELRDEYVVIASHHPPRTLVNDYVAEGFEKRVLAREVVEAILEFDNVLAWLTGHEHANHVTLHSNKKGKVIPEFGTSSLIDWPQQSRILEFGIEASGERIYASRIINHESPVMPDKDLTSPGTLASWSRLLAANDYQRRDVVFSIDRAEGFASDRDFLWRLPALR
jgi:metallophosphoesterase (TIGR03767 family)